MICERLEQWNRSRPREFELALDDPESFRDHEVADEVLFVFFLKFDRLESSISGVNLYPFITDLQWLCTIGLLTLQIRFVMLPASRHLL